MSTKAFNRVHLSYRPHPLRFYRPTRLALLFDVDPSTIWRWEQTGVLPPFVDLGPGVRGLTEEMLKEHLDKLREVK